LRLSWPIVKPSDLSLLRLPGNPTLTPDGRYAVVALRRLDLETDDYTAQLWGVPTDGEDPPRQLTYGWRDGEPRVSPDGRWLAFVRAPREEPGGGAAAHGPAAKPQIHVMSLAGGEPRRLTNHPLGADSPVWSHDSTRLAYLARVPEDGRYGTAEGKSGDKEPPRRITRMFYRVDGLGFRLDRPRHVFVIDALASDALASDAVVSGAVVSGAAPAQVTDGEYDHGGVDWSPREDLLAFVSARHDDHDNDLVSDIWVAAPDGTRLRALTDSTLSAGGQPTFSADGSEVCFTAVETGPDRREAAIRSDVAWSVPVDGSAPARRLMDHERYHLTGPGGQIVGGRDGLLFPNENRGAVELLEVPYDGGEPRVLLDGARQVLSVASAGDTVVAMVADPASWGDLVVRVADGPQRRLTDWSATFSSTVDIRAQEELTATAPDGYPVHGWVVRPEGKGPHPVLLMIHGGPYTQYGWKLFDEAQVYAGAGYAVVMGNPRGSSGYGEAHGRAVVGNVGGVSSTDVLALLDAALKADDLDPTRVGVLGGSHGGYLTTWLAAQHGDRFKAAISERAVNAIDSFTGSSDIGWFFSDDVYGSDRATQHAQSPLSHVDRIDIPMLIIHSEHDWRCPLEQAQRLYVALKLRGVPTELLLFPGEGHELSRSGLPSHRIARFEAILDWWRRYL
jgi:dipeptidyl aminopeptidase/acylaminoacyl peptidase